MRKCAGNNTQDWGFDTIFDIKCPQCGKEVEFFKDEIIRNCPACKLSIKNNKEHYGCGQSCTSATQYRSRCSKFRKTKARYYGNY